MNYLRMTLILLVMSLSVSMASARALFPKSINYNDYDGSSSGSSSGGNTPNVNYTGSPNHRGTFVAPVNGTCKVSCGSNASVQVDVTARCMCISGEKCFTVDIGFNGPMMTTNGRGTLGVANGALYKTHPGPGLTSLNRNGSRDNDAISMGISANDQFGKWIHKSRGCGANGNPDIGGRSNTAGCIAIPCGHWPLVKDQMGKSLEVCRGNNQATTIDGGRKSGRKRSGNR